MIKIVNVDIKCGYTSVKISVDGEEILVELRESGKFHLAQMNGNVLDLTKMDDEGIRGGYLMNGGEQRFFVLYEDRVMFVNPNLVGTDYERVTIPTRFGVVSTNLGCRGILGKTKFGWGMGNGYDVVLSNGKHGVVLDDLFYCED